MIGVFYKRCNTNVTTQYCLGTFTTRVLQARLAWLGLRASPEPRGLRVPRALQVAMARPLVLGRQALQVRLGRRGSPEDRGRVVQLDFREGLEPLVPLERQDQVDLRDPLGEMACKAQLVPRVLVARQECRVEQAATRRVPRDPLDSQGPPASRVVPIRAPPDQRVCQALQD